MRHIFLGEKCYEKINFIVCNFIFDVRNFGFGSIQSSG